MFMCISSIITVPQNVYLQECTYYRTIIVHGKRVMTPKKNRLFVTKCTFTQKKRCKKICVYTY